MDWLNELGGTKKALDDVSPSFCLAKWLQVTLHLQNGNNHSCHHPDVHKTPLSELAANPGALHNTAFKKDLWNMMRQGKRPAECQFCWEVEDTPGAHFSDRVVKSHDSWARARMNEVAGLPPEANINPSYVEVSFGNLCNFRCVYCAPHISSALWNQYEKHGAYVDRNELSELESMGIAPFQEGTPNPYVDAFWRWLPEISADLRILRVTGGEPLLNPNTFRLLDYFEQHSHPELELCVNSNFGIPEKFFRDFLDRLQRLTARKKMKKFMMFTSTDSSGIHAEYMRAGLNYDIWLNNLHRYLESGPWQATIMVTFNLLSAQGFSKFLSDMMELNRKFKMENHPDPLEKRVIVDITHLRFPEYLSISILDEAGRKRIAEVNEYMHQHSQDQVGVHGFNRHELNKMSRITTMIATQTPDPEKVERIRGSFYLFTKQNLAREKKWFLDLFPEMAEFHADCKRAAVASGRVSAEDA